MPILRCDRTTAWSALHSHYQAHGRDFDLREAFAADPGRFESLSLQAPEVFADLSKNRLDTATLALPARPRPRVRHRGAARRHAARRARQTTEGRAVLHTALRAPPARRPISAEVHGVLDAMLAFAESVRDTAAQRHPARRQHRHRRQRPGRADGGAGARRLRAARHSRSTSSPTSMATTSRRCCASSTGRHAVHRRQQDLHDAGDDGQRAGREGLVRGQRRHRRRNGTSSPPPPT